MMVNKKSDFFTPKIKNPWVKNEQRSSQQAELSRQ
jgi:hypothetical protein